ncbi:vesicle transport protein Use1 isoform X2 [Lycorma delicatula]
MIQELQNSEKQPTKDTLSSYIKRVEFLKGLMETNKIVNPVEKAVAAQLLSPGPTAPDSISKEIHKKTTSKYNTQLRQQLMGDKATEGLRQRQIGTSGDDLDVLLKYHHSVQEKIADDMLGLARSMKEQSKLANIIIKRDTETVEKSSVLAEKNFSQLREESERLQEHSKRVWKCWLWVMLILVFAIFICMVLFMRVMKKRQ